MRNIAVLTMMCVGLAACAGTDWSRNVYEGVRQSQKINPPQPDKPATTPALPNYDRYEAEREGLKSPKN